MTNASENASTFQYGVASGDPEATSVVLWTHAKPEGVADNADVTVTWEVSTDPDFNTIVSQGSGTTNADVDYTFKVVADNLAPGGEYYYRFSVDGEQSDVGQTRTLPKGSIDSIAFAVFSCVNYPAGFFNAYDAAVENGFDFSIHLGDYIYEYGIGGYATEQAEALGRLPSPETELVTLDDYLGRYAQYTSDEDLQALRAHAPMIMMWDDHETANDSWESGAENHDNTDPDAPEFGVPWDDRVEAGLDAYFLWNPIREPESGDLKDHDKSYEFGDLVDLHMPETRLQARDETRADILAATEGKLTSYLAGGDAGAAEFFFDGAFVGLDQATLQSILDAGRLAAATNDVEGLAQFNNTASPIALTGLVIEANDPNRDMIGDEQLAELVQKIGESDATWQIIGSQTLMGRMELPPEVLIGFTDFAEVFIRLTLGATTPEDEAVLAQLDALETKVPYNFDSWDGYQFEREVILNALAESDSGGVVIAGDTHNAWTSNIRTADGKLAAVEFAGPGTTSPGFEVLLPEVLNPVTGDPVDYAATAFLRYVDDLLFANLQDRGYMSVNVTEEEVSTDYVFVSTTQSQTYETEVVNQSVSLTQLEPLLGTTGADTQNGTAVADAMFGFGGNDLLSGGLGDDAIHGGRGNDTIRGGVGDDELTGGRGRDVLFGGAGDDELFGNSGFDTLNGGQGNDLLSGGNGNDLLRGFVGDDTLEGGGGKDAFVFKLGGGADEILDFQNDLDVLRLDATLWNDTALTFTEVLTQFATDVNGGVRFAFAGGETLVLANFANKADLQDDMVFI